LLRAFCYGLVEARSLLSRQALGACRTRWLTEVNTPSVSIQQAEHMMKKNNNIDKTLDARSYPLGCRNG
jgi:hypothetical protein